MSDGGGVHACIKFLEIGCDINVDLYLPYSEYRKHFAAVNVSHSCLEYAGNLWINNKMITDTDSDNHFEFYPLKDNDHDIFEKNMAITQESDDINFTFSSSLYPHIMIHLEKGMLGKR